MNKYIKNAYEHFDWIIDQSESLEELQRTYAAVVDRAEQAIREGGINTDDEREACYWMLKALEHNVRYLDICQHNDESIHTETAAIRDGCFEKIGDMTDDQTDKEAQIERLDEAIKAVEKYAAEKEDDDFVNQEVCFWTLTALETAKIELVRGTSSC